MIITHSWNKICLYTALTARRNSKEIKSGCTVAINQDAWVSKQKLKNKPSPNRHHQKQSKTACEKKLLVRVQASVEIWIARIFICRAVQKL